MGRVLVHPDTSCLEKEEDLAQLPISKVGSNQALANLSFFL